MAGPLDSVFHILKHERTKASLANSPAIIQEIIYCLLYNESIQKVRYTNPGIGNLMWVIII